MSGGEPLIRIAVFLVLVLAIEPPSCAASYPTYNLDAQTNDWVEYYVAEAKSWWFFENITKGDTLRFNIVDSVIMDRIYFNGTTAFAVEDAICDIDRNGVNIRRNQTMGEMLFYPAGVEHWKSLMPIEQHWMEMLPVYAGINYESNISITEDEIVFASKSTGAIDGGFRAVVDEGTGIATEFTRYLNAGGDRNWYYRLVISNTNIEGVLDGENAQKGWDSLAFSPARKVFTWTVYQSAAILLFVAAWMMI